MNDNPAAPASKWLAIIALVVTFIFFFLTWAALIVPSVVDGLVTADEVAVKVLRTDDPWFGVTYRADRSIAMRCVRERIAAGVYPQELWGQR